MHGEKMICDMRQSTDSESIVETIVSRRCVGDLVKSEVAEDGPGLNHNKGLIGNANDRLSRRQYLH